MFNIVLFGPPGAGKGTQAVKLAAAYNLEHLSTGDILRAEMNKNSTLGLKVKSLIERGELVPDETVIKIIGEKLKSVENVAGFIFDGFPRTVEQAKSLDEMLAKESLEISIMITLEVAENELVERIRLRSENSGRADDSDTSVIKNRIKVYNEQTAIVADYYKTQGKYASVSNMGTIEETFNLLTSEIDGAKK